jgi:hypothetical protein
MLGSNGSPIPSPLRRAAERFNRWRYMHERGTRIPDRLWQLAVELAAAYGVSRTASALKLDYYSLKRRLGEEDSPAVLASGLHSPSAFVELSPSTLVASGECVIDLENSCGAKMRIHWKGMVPDLVALSRGFWSIE